MKNQPASNPLTRKFSGVVLQVLVVSGLVTAIGATFVTAIVVEPAQAKRKTNLPSSNIFSSPDSDGDVVPTFVGAGGKPMNANKELRMPQFDTIKAVPSLTKDQRKLVDDAQKDLNTRVSGLRDHITSLQAELEVAKAHPEEKVVIQDKTISKMDDLRRQISDLRKQIDTKQKEALQSVVATVLTDEQRELLARMRRGEFIINGSQNADGKPGLIEHPMAVDSGNARKSGRTTGPASSAATASAPRTWTPASSTPSKSKGDNSDTLATEPKHSLFGGAKRFFGRAFKGQ